MYGNGDLSLRQSVSQQRAINQEVYLPVATLPGQFGMKLICLKIKGPFRLELCKVCTYILLRSVCDQRQGLVKLSRQASNQLINFINCAVQKVTICGRPREVRLGKMHLIAYHAPPKPLTAAPFVLSST